MVKPFIFGFFIARGDCYHMQKEKVKIAVKLEKIQYSY